MTWTFARFAFSISRLVRIDKPLAAAIVTLVGAYLGSNRASVFSPSTLRAALAMGLVVAFSFVLNDLKDAVADGIAKPSRPIPSGRISSRFGFGVALALAIGALAVASTLGPLLAAFVILLITLSICYSYWLKRTPLFGNGLIGFMIASILVYGALVDGHITWAVVKGSTLVFLFAFSTEILYTIPDEEADRKAGSRTVTVRFGGAQAFRLFQLTALSLAGLGVLYWLMGIASNAYILAAMLCSIAPIVLTVVVTRSGSQRSVQTATWVMRRISLVSLIPILLLR